MGLVLKFAILFFCIRHVLICGRPGLTAFIEGAQAHINSQNCTYVYGNSGSNRAVVKCVEQGPMSSFLYLAVAGPVKEDVERLRNEIAREM